MAQQDQYLTSRMFLHYFFKIIACAPFFKAPPFCQLHSPHSFTTLWSSLPDHTRVTRHRQFFTKSLDNLLKNLNVKLDVLEGHGNGWPESELVISQRHKRDAETSTVPGIMVTAPEEGYHNERRAVWRICSFYNLDR